MMYAMAHNWLFYNAHPHQNASFALQGKQKHPHEHSQTNCKQHYCIPSKERYPQRFQSATQLVKSWRQRHAAEQNSSMQDLIYMYIYIYILYIYSRVAAKRSNSRDPLALRTQIQHSIQRPSALLCLALHGFT